MILNSCMYCERELDGVSDTYCRACSDMYLDTDEACAACGTLGYDAFDGCSACELGGPRGGAGDFYGIRRAG